MLTLRSQSHLWTESIFFSANINCLCEASAMSVRGPNTGVLESLAPNVLKKGKKKSPDTGLSSPAKME